METVLVNPIATKAGPEPETFVRMERKFALPRSRVGYALAWLRQRVVAADDYPVSWINSVYFDTPELEAYEDCLNGDFAKHKIRFRWYGGPGRDGNENVPVYLEIKSKAGLWTSKQRVSFQCQRRDLDEARISQTLRAFNVDNALLEMGFRMGGPLRPVVYIRYHRHRFRGLTESATSMTLDDRIESFILSPELSDGRGWLPVNFAVLEIKGQDFVLPPFLVGLNRAASDWRSFSKYAKCLQTHFERAGTYDWLRPY